MCLGQDDAADLRSVLRRSESDGPVVDAIERAIDIDRSAAVSRHMNVTGG